MLKIVETFQQKGTDHKNLLIVSCSIYSFLIWVSETIQTVFLKIRLDMLMLKIVEILQQKGTDHKTLLIVSCSINSSLIWVSETNQTVFLKIRLDILMLKIKIVEIIIKQKGADHKALLIVSCSVYSFLIWVSETIQIAFLKIRLDMLMLKIVEIFQQKGTDQRTLLIASCSIY